MFGNLPESVREELQVMCVLFTEEAGGILTLEFDEHGQLLFRVAKEDADTDHARPHGGRDG